jgi:hypothetical protein
MKFNHELNGLDQDDRLLLDGLDISAQALRYALDQALLNEVEEALIQSLKTYGVDIATEDGGDWLRQGLRSRVFNPKTQVEQRGRLKLRIALEFCPDGGAGSDLAEAILDVEALEAEALAIEVAPYPSAPLPIPCITLIRLSHDS